MNTKAIRPFLLAIIIVLASVMALNSMNGQTGGTGLFKGTTKELKFGEFQDAVKAHEIKSVTWIGKAISGKFENGTEYTATGPSSDSPAAVAMLSTFEQAGLSGEDLDIREPSQTQQFVAYAATSLLIPIVIIAIIYFMFIRPAQNGGNQAMSFGRSRAKRVGENAPKVTFEDVAGIDEVKAELFEIVDFLKNTKKYVSLGAKIPKGILLTGPPGVGKTYLARAIAGEAGVPFFHISGSDFVEMFVGVGAARVRDLFETAKAHRPCLIFVDEIDAVGRQRGAGLGGGHDEREQTLNQLLVEMDGFDVNSGVIMIAATNRPDVLDPALLRPGRFDRQLVVDAPDSKGREAILKVHSKGKPFEPDVNFGTIAKRTPGFSGADLANTLNESALLSARYGKTKISMNEIEEALDRVLVGPARKSRQMLERDRRLTAYHEAGHAIVGEILEHSDPIHKVTILPRGMALGLTWSLPNDEKFSESRSELMADIAMSLGGLVAEEVVFGERWTGATSDLDRVTRVARAMVTRFGMSDKLGTLAIGRRSHNPFMGRDMYEDRDYSEAVAQKVDEEVKRIVDECHATATKILTENRDKLDRLAEALLERETIEREDFLAVMEGRPLPPIDPPTASGTTEPADSASSAPNKAGPMPPPRLEPGPA